jgi:hypothetical protein
MRRESLLLPLARNQKSALICITYCGVTQGEFSQAWWLWFA